ncbi:lipopolysaccharide assembly protein LapA domain-containing protein [Rheinheimera sp. UJ63]|uniref:lipopolysaccharide assembly protein LapA domain-containing protein n=1 Tax=Rheinheimera sp. UJ63 TaxID=2910157 RepID=UPI001F213151|nr:LapA family protein [Rheinheimera sp. UJ63]MCF4009521.1 LapA family protein [Rheinheimera sp. UJ63]
MSKFKAIMLLILLSCTVIFVMQNTETVEISFLFWRFALSRIFMMLFLLLMGFVLGVLVTRWFMRKGKKTTDLTTAD